MTNVETLIVTALSESPALQQLTAPGQPRIEAFMDVPPVRPVRFITVERTSGAERDLVDRPVLAVQMWAESRYEASQAATELGRILDALPGSVPQLGLCKVESLYNFPDERQARYQLTVRAATVRA